MDYHYNSNNTTTTVDTNLMPFHHQQQQQQQQHHHQQQQSFAYNNQFQRPDTLHILTSPTDDMFNRSQQWSTHGNILSPSDMMDCNSNTNEELNQPERGIAGFVSKLYQCLQAPDDGHKYARWCRHNGIDMFIIDCIPKFTEIVLPRLFKHCKFASFVRQLNIYGFQRDTDARKSKDSKDKETCRWHHIHFRPGRRDLFHLIRRKTPRYSRRKRPKTEEEDPETILNVGSGDDESDNNILEDEDTNSSSLDERRRSASSTSSSVTLHHQQQLQQHHQTGNNNNNNNNNNITEYKPRQLHMIFESPQELMDQNNDPAYLQVTQPQHSSSSSSSSSSPQYCNFPSNSMNHQISPLPITADGSEVDNNEMNNDPHDLLLMQQTMTQDEEQLRSQIVQLRRGYLRMYKILTGEVNKAFNLIDVQRSRIEFLENMLRNNHGHQQHQHQQHQQQMRIRQHEPVPFIDTNTNNYFSNPQPQPPPEYNNNNTTTTTTTTTTATTATTTNTIAATNNNILQHHSTAPSTPIYPQDTFAQQSPLNNRVVQGGYEFLFNNSNDDDLKLSSPCSSVVPEKWIPTPPAFHHNTQISGLSSAVISASTTTDS